MSDCFRRAFAVGLAFKGAVNPDLSFIPAPADVPDIQEACKRFGLTYVGDGRSLSFKLGNKHTPCLVVYYTPKDGPRKGHAVFLSDVKIFEDSGLKIHSVIIGWDGNHDHEVLASSSNDPDAIRLE